MKRLIIWLIILSGLGVIVYNEAYNRMYAKAQEEIRLKEEEKKIEKANLLKEIKIAMTDKIKKSYLDDLVSLGLKHHLDINTLLYLANISAEFDIKPSDIVGLLILVSFEHPERTKYRVKKIISEQKERLYWFKKSSTCFTDTNKERMFQIKQKELLLKKSQVQLALSEIITKNEKIKRDLQMVQSVIIHEKWPNLAKWKGPKEEGGGH